jgi:hypothetical protein
MIQNVVNYGSVFAASRICSDLARTEKFSITIRQRTVPDESSRNSAGRAMISAACQFFSLNQIITTDCFEFWIGEKSKFEPSFRDFSEARQR